MAGHGLKPRLAGFLQSVTERHEFIDLGDDPVLFGERGERNGKRLHLLLGRVDR